MSNKSLEIKIDEDIVRTVLNEKITEAIGTSIIDKEVVLNQMISKMLNMRVNSKGEPCTYRDAVSYIDWAATQAMQRAVKSALEKVMSEKEVEITKMVENQIIRSKGKLARSLVGALAESLAVKWSSTVQVVLKD